MARRIVRERSGGVCEGCGAARATSWSHRVGRGVGGLWCPTNGLDLCGDGVTGCHGWATRERSASRPDAARLGRGWVLRSTDDPTTFPAFTAMWGWVRLTEDGMYVPAEAPDPRSVLGV